jgi:hypothetical protein
VLAVVDEAPDRAPQAVIATWPGDGATGVPPGARLVLSLADQVDTRSVRADTVVLRPLDGGDAVPVVFGVQHTLVHVSPLRPLEEDTSYELLLPAGGLTDLVGNPLVETWSAVFSTGARVASVPCAIEPQPPALAGQPAPLRAAPVPGATYTWTLGDGGVVGPGPSPEASWTFAQPGRPAVQLTVQVGDAARRCSAVQIVHRPLLGAPAASGSVVIDEARGVAWLAQADVGTVAKLGLDGALRAELPVGEEPFALAARADGGVWVADRAGDRLLLVSGDAVSQQIDLRYGAAPAAIVLSPDEQTAWVALEEAGAVAVVDLGAGRVTDEIPLGPDALGLTPPVRALALTPDGALLLAARRTSGPEAGEVYVLDTALRAVRETLVLPYDEGPDDHDSGRGVPNQITAIAVSPDGDRVVVPAKKDNTRRGGARDGEPLDPDNAVRSVVAWLSLADGVEALPARRAARQDPVPRRRDSRGVRRTPTIACAHCHLDGEATA